MHLKQNIMRIMRIMSKIKYGKIQIQKPRFIITIQLIIITIPLHLLADSFIQYQTSFHFLFAFPQSCPIYLHSFLILNFQYLFILHYLFLFNYFSSINFIPIIYTPYLFCCMQTQESNGACSSTAQQFFNDRYELLLQHNMNNLEYAQYSIQNSDKNSQQEDILLQFPEKKDESTVIDFDKAKGTKEEGQCQRILRSKTNPKKRKLLSQVKKNKEKKKTNRRKKDQNLCKKYHNLALKVIENLKLGKIIKQYKNLIYRQDFFILVLVIAKIKGVFEQFKQGYLKETKDFIQALKKENPKKREAKKKNEDLIYAINNSLQAMDIFSQNRTVQAIERMFNKQLRNKNYIDDSIWLISQIQLQLKN